MTAKLVRPAPPYPTQAIIDAVLAAPGQYFGDKKYVTNLTVTLPSLPQIDLESIGYKKPAGKLAQLERHYCDPQEIERTRALLTARTDSDMTALTVSLRGAPKTREGSQGWCIETLTIVKTARTTEVAVRYRQTEVILKLAADFIFLQSLIDRLELRPQKIHFHFASAWLGMQFLPALLRRGPPERFLERLRVSDTWLWKSATYYLSRYLGERAIGFGPADRQKKFLASSWDGDRKESVREYLIQHNRLIENQNAIL